VVAFGGRAMEDGQQPKYLNSPETTIYTKGRTLYGLHLTKKEISRLGYAVMVEGYFDFAQLVQAGIMPVVASSGTALTAAQAQLLRRFTSKVILSFDPDAAGQGAAARSCDLLVTEGFEVNVAVLPPGDDPDQVVRKRGREGYLDLLKNSRPYLEYLLDRSAVKYDLNNDEGRRQFLTAMLPVAARIPTEVGREQFGERLAHKARITQESVRAEVRKAAVHKRSEPAVLRELPSFGQVKSAEKGLIWALIHEPHSALAALKILTDNDLDGLTTRSILEQAKKLSEEPPDTLPSAVLERLNTVEVELVTRIAAEPHSPWPAMSCAREFQQLHAEREFAAIQREIRRVQEAGEHPDSALLERSLALARQLEQLSRMVH
jgi:DNA primase